MKAKQTIFSLLILLASVVCSSCVTRDYGYSSGVYLYSYYLINDLQEPVTLHQKFNSSEENTVIAPGDTLLFSSVGYESWEMELEDLKKPSLDAGYRGSMQTYPTTLTVNGTTYDIDKDQERSFMKCANYSGMLDPKKDFFYNYYFYINADYIASLQSKK